MSIVTRIVLGVAALSMAASSFGVSDVSGGESTAVTLHTYKAADGQTYGALLVRPDLPDAVNEAHDVVVLVDTSASQTGPIRTQSLGLVRALLDELGTGARVHLIALDVTAKPLTASLSPNGSAEVRSAIAALEQRSPLGTCDLYAGLVSALGSFGSERRSRSVIFIGDGHSTATVFGANKLAAIAGQLRSERVVVHSVGVGSDVADAVLDRLATETGGRSFSEIGRETSLSRVAAGLVKSIAAPVMYPRSVRLSGESVAMVPEVAPPLRADQATLFLTRGEFGSSVSLTLDGEWNGQSMARELNISPVPHSETYAYLPNLWEQWQSDKRVAATGDGRESLLLAQADQTQSVLRMNVLGRIALARGMVDEAEKFAREALKLDASNLEAKNLLRDLAEKPAPPPLALASAPQAQEPPAAGRQDPPPADRAPATPQSRAEIDQARRIEQAATEQLRAQTNAELAEARRLMSREPERAINLLKGVTLLRIDAALDVPESDRANLRRQVESNLRQAAREKERVDLSNAEAQKRAAEAAELKKLSNIEFQRQQQQSQNMDQFWALMQERSYREALMIARRNRELNYGSPLPELQTFMAETSANWYELLDLREIRKHRLLLTLISVDKSHIPFPDEPPIEYPDHTWWEEMSKRRKKWSRVDLTVPSKAEEMINEKLKDPVTLEFVETPLSDVIDFLKDYTQVNIVLDKPALEEEGITSDTPVSIHVQSIALRSALRVLLGQYNLTYLIKDDVLRITSKLQADNELVHKVYPVADLVIPVGAGGMMGGGMGGMGGMMGGMGGGGGGMGGMGGGGGGMGAMGGGGGMGGFGFRNFPNQPPGGEGGAGGGAGAGEDLSDDLIELIQDAIAPETWDVRGGQGSIHYYRPNPALIIRQTSEGHGEVGDSLGQLRGDSDSKPRRMMGLRNVNP